MVCVGSTSITFVVPESSVSNSWNEVFGRGFAWVGMGWDFWLCGRWVWAATIVIVIVRARHVTAMAQECTILGYRVYSVCGSAVGGGVPCEIALSAIDRV